MTTKVLFVQGGGEGVYEDWDSKLVTSLREHLGTEFEVVYPRMPNEGAPTYPLWRSALHTEFEKLPDDTILVGHSIGGTILVHAIAELEPERNWPALCLIAAPYVGEGGWAPDEDDPQAELASTFPKSTPVLLFHGLSDEEIPVDHTHLYAKTLPGASTHLLEGKDHQLNNDLSDVAAVILSRLAPT